MSPILTQVSDDGGEFEKNYINIYPPEPKLKKENTNNDHATFLDLDITIVDKQFITKLYDKRNDFHFSIARLPFKDCNIPSKIFCSCISTEVLRICRATSLYPDFLNSSKTLLTRMYNQGPCKNSLVTNLKKMLNNHSEEFSKYHKTSMSVMYDLFSSN